jgi:tetratricopeptide (TPR) repeat protein
LWITFTAGETINAIGRAHLASGRYQDALESQEKAAEFFRQVLPENHPRIGHQMFQIGNIFAQAGEFHRAIEKAGEALRVFQAALLPSSHPYVEMNQTLVRYCQNRLYNQL